jgi:hypothetical protein
VVKNACRELSKKKIMSSHSSDWEKTDKKCSKNITQKFESDLKVWRKEALMLTSKKLQSCTYQRNLSVLGNITSKGFLRKLSHIFKRQFNSFGSYCSELMCIDRNQLENNVSKYT